MDFPSINSPPPRPADPLAPSPRSRSYLRAWQLMLLMLAAVFGPCTAIQIPREIGRWKLTEAIRLRQAGDKDAAYVKLNDAIGWFPNSWELRLTRAEWYLADGR